MDARQIDRLIDECYAADRGARVGYGGYLEAEHLRAALARLDEIIEEHWWSDPNKTETTLRAWFPVASVDAAWSAWLSGQCSMALREAAVAGSMAARLTVARIRS